MHNTLVDLSVLYSAAAEAYFTNADRRIMSGLRATLDMLRAPYPDYACRRAGYTLPGTSIAAAFKADNPQYQPLTPTPRRDNASPERVATAKALRQSN